MTATPSVNTPPVPVPVLAQPGTRLDQLLASYETLKAEAAEAVSRYEALTDAIKAELAASAPAGTEAMILAGSPGLPQLRMTWKRPWRFDAKRFRAEHPRLYVRYEVRGGHWDLRQDS